MDTEPQLYISISGLIGAGKSTLATELGKVMHLPVYYESVSDNEYLADFYTDIERYSFPMQIYQLNKRFQQQQQIIWQKAGAIQDRTIYEDRIFARMLCNSGLMNERDYQTYINLFSNMSNFMCRPNLIVHLDVSPEESMRRIKMRNRDCEKNITIEYLQALHTEYEYFLTEIAKAIPVIRVDYSEFKSAKDMAEMINKEYSKMSNIINV